MAHSPLIPLTAPTWGLADKYGLAWCDDISQAGLAFVGYCDQIISSVRHYGWHCDEYGDTTYRGAVFLDNNRDSPLYFAGYVSSDDCDIKSRRSPACPNAARIDVSQSFKTAEQAAADADSCAEWNACSEREYKERWQNAMQAHDNFCSAMERLGESVSLYRDALRAKAEMSNKPSAARILCSALENLEAARDAARKRRDEYMTAGRYLADCSHKDKATILATMKDHFGTVGRK